MPEQGFENDSSNFTPHNKLKKVDCSAQSYLNPPVNHSVQKDEVEYVDQSAQKFESG